MSKRFFPNYPYPDAETPYLLPTPDRVAAPGDVTGRGVVIAFIDAGFAMHPDLGDRVIVHVDAATNHIVEQPRVESLSDYSWHGQMTSVIACGDGSTSGGRYRGIARDARLVLVKVTTPRGQIKEADILRGLRWVADTHRRFGVRIVNISVGGDFQCDDADHPLHQIIRRLTGEGVVVIAASGNHGSEHLVPPASAGEAITVGGYDDHNSLDRGRWTRYHSDYGRAYDGRGKPDILAPAEWIASPILPGSQMQREARWLAPLLDPDEDAERRAMERLLGQGFADLSIGRDRAAKPDGELYAMLQARINTHKLIDAAHQFVDGTSVAAAVVSSVVAQMIEVNPALSPDQVAAILRETAQHQPDMSPAQQGAGRIDPLAAVNRARAWAGITH